VTNSDSNQYAVPEMGTQDYGTLELGPTDDVVDASIAY
jgi:hypothetical protein